MLRLSEPLISVQDLPAAIKLRSRFSSSGVQRIQEFAPVISSPSARARPGGERHLSGWYRSRLPRLQPEQSREEAFEPQYGGRGRQSRDARDLSFLV